MSSCRVTEVPGRPWDARLCGLYRARVGSQVVRRRSMTRRLPPCCASAASGVASTAPRPATKARRFITRSCARADRSAEVASQRKPHLSVRTVPLQPMARSSDFSARSSVGWGISACPRLSDRAR
jgi:hypothetical protein